MTPARTVCSPCESVAAAISDLRAAGACLVSPEADRYWSQHSELVEESHACAGLYPHLESLRDKEVVLGFLGRSHLGDIICMSPLPRLLTQRGCRVFVVRHRGIYKVFANNPYLAGYKNEERLPLSDFARGPGHIIQKLARAFGIAPDPFPKGELYLSDDELRWAWSVRRSLPRNKPVAIVCANSVSDNCVVPSASLGWQRCVDVLERRFAVVQVAVTRMSCIEEVMRPTRQHVAAWRPDRVLDNCFVLENLPARHFFALFAVSSFFVGTNTGSSHVAAAFGVPSLLVLGARQYRTPPRFPDRINGNQWRHESFLYPQGTFVLQAGSNDER